MKKLLLSAISFCAMALCANAQEVRFLGEMQVSKISNDGKTIVATDMDGNAYVYDYDTDETTMHEAGFDIETGLYTPRYFFGFGRACADNGMMVGAIDECTPAYLQNGEWKALPIPAELHKPGFMSQADDITADGKRICGVLANAAFGSDGDVTIVPCIWDRKADGSYSDPVVLPYPKMDFTGRVNQYVTARAISADGKTIIGQVTDYSGFYVLPIVFKQDAKGEWSYEVICKSLVYNEETVWPVIPEEPKEVDPTDYMDAAHAAAYLAAVAAHDQAVDDYWMNYDYENPENNVYPDDVDLSLYVTDVEGYNAAVEAYNAAAIAYNEALEKFWEMQGDPENIYGPAFEFNNLCLSADGRYYATMYGMPDDSDPFAWFPQMIYKTIIVDLQDGNKIIECPQTDVSPVCFLADGTLVMSTPIMDTTRDAILWKAGSAPETLLDHIAATNPAAAQALRDEWTYNLAEIDWDTYDMIQGEEVCWLGTCIANPSGTVWTGWQSNNFYGVDDWYTLGWCMNVGGADAINSTKATANSIKSYIVTDLSGAVLYKGADAAAAKRALVRGVNIVTNVMADGKTDSYKFIKK